MKRIGVFFIAMCIGATQVWAVVTSEAVKIRANGDGSTVDFDFPFRYFEDTDLKVYKIDTSSDPEVATLQTLSTDYSVTPANTGEGGTITYVTAPTADEDSFIKLDLPYKNEVDIPTGGVLREEAIENAKDINALLIQQLDERVDRSFTLSETSSITGVSLDDPVDSRGLKWELDGSDWVLTTSDYDPDEQVTLATAQAVLAQGYASTAQANAALTAADVVSTNADVVSTNADVVSTNADVLSCAASAVDAANSASLASTYASFSEDSSVVQQNPLVAGYDEDFVFGSPTLDYDSTHGKRLIFDVSKGFFAAGQFSTGAAVDNANRGDVATAFGFNSKAPGQYSFAANYYADAAGESSASFGNMTDADGQYSFSMGNQTLALANGSFALGYQSNAEGVYSIAAGVGSKTRIRGEFAISSGTFASDGDCQVSRVTYRADTTDNTPEIMYPDNSATNRFTLESESAWRFDGVVVATLADCSASASWTIKGVIHRDNAGNTEVIWSDVTEDVDEITASVALSADDTNEALSITITGAAATNIKWMAYLDVGIVRFP